jgi:hypothetical protein
VRLRYAGGMAGRGVGVDRANLRPARLRTPGAWAALLLVAVGAVLGYRRARAKGHRDLAIGLLIGIAAGLVTGFGALIALTAAVLSNFT